MSERLEIERPIHTRELEQRLDLGSKLEDSVSELVRKRSKAKRNELPGRTVQRSCRFHIKDEALKFIQLHLGTELLFEVHQQLNEFQ